METLAKFNLKYDSSLMDNEEPYVIKSHGIVELPVAWSWDDWGPFEVHRRSPSVVLNGWIQEFDALYAAKMPYFNLTMHPQTIGRASRIAMLESLMKTMKRRKGVRFSRCIDLAREITFET
jgi:peptidoglycan/xylan/chitin deacetylase (PgdA/CDA1 family)